MERRSFIKSLAAALVAPKLPATRDINPDYVDAKPVELLTAGPFDTRNYAGEWKFVMCEQTYADGGVRFKRLFDHAAPKEPA